MFFPPLFREGAGKGLVENGGFAGFKAVQGLLDQGFGLVQLVKQAFDAVDDALLFGQGWEGDRYYI